MSSPILVIGALGNVGTEVVRQILARGGKVRAADMDVNKLRERFGEAVERSVLISPIHLLLKRHLPM